MQKFTNNGPHPSRVSTWTTLHRLRPKRSKPLSRSMGEVLVRQDMMMTKQGSYFLGSLLFSNSENCKA